MKIKHRGFAFLISIILIISCVAMPFTASAYAGTMYENEPNDGIGAASRTYNDFYNYGRFQSTGDNEDWWVVSFTVSGYANFWLGNIPSGCDFNMYIYNSSGALLTSSTKSGQNFEYIPSLSVTGGVNYYIRIVRAIGTSSSYYNMWVKSSNTARIMQGNTQSESDCRIFYTGLYNNGYRSINTNGWTYTNANSSSISQQRVTDSQFLGAKSYTVAYYSGHGGKAADTQNFPAQAQTAMPILNFIPSNANNDYGTSSPFAVDDLLKVRSSNWQTTCEWKPSDAIRVLVLSTCSQLDSSIVKYYARIMKASGVMAIAGYHEPAPTQPIDDYIASSFISYAQAGNSIWYSWQNANIQSGTVYDWAVLVYQENSNQYYRLPGFPGNKYVPPSSSASVYRYGNYWSSGVVTPLSAPLTPGGDLPLSLSITDTVSSRGVSSIAEREPVDTNISLPENDTIALTALEEVLTKEEIQNATRMVSSIIREEVDVDLGVLEETATTVGRTYLYHNTYKGVKITDSFIAVSVDSEGVYSLINGWKTGSISPIDEKNVLESQANALVSRESAISTARAESSVRYDEQEPIVYSCELAYTPISDGLYRLCYEIISSGGRYYIDVETGAIME